MPSPVGSGSSHEVLSARAADMPATLALCSRCIHLPVVDRAEFLSLNLLTDKTAENRRASVASYQGYSCLISVWFCLW